MTYSAGNRKDIRRAEKDAKIASSQERDVIVNLCATAPGRRWVWERLSAAHIFTATYTGDVNQMLFFEGERNQGLQLLAQVMAHCPEQFTEMQREANVRSHTDDARSERGTSGPSGERIHVGYDITYDPVDRSAYDSDYSDGNSG